MSTASHTTVKGSPKVYVGDKTVIVKVVVPQPLYIEAGGALYVHLTEDEGRGLHALLDNDHDPDEGEVAP